MNSVDVTVSGSFRRHLSGISDAVETFTALGCRVLSPQDPRVVDSFGEFLFVASDRLRTIRTVQNRHLAAIAASRFVWLVAPDGYVGQSAAMEIGYAVALGVPVRGTTPPMDLTLRQYVEIVPSLSSAVVGETRADHRGNVKVKGEVLLDPAAVTEQLHQDLEMIRSELTRPHDLRSADDVVRRSQRLRAALDM
jgi:hypothetical protein